MKTATSKEKRETSGKSLLDRIKELVKDESRNFDYDFTLKTEIDEPSVEIVSELIECSRISWIFPT